MASTRNPRPTRRALLAGAAASSVLTLPAIAGANDPDAETRAIAAMTFEALPVDPAAFSAENMARRAAEEGVLNRTAQFAMGKNDVELTAWAADVLRQPSAEGEPDGFDVVTKLIDTFAAHAEALRDGAKVRLVVALHRAGLQLDEEAAPPA